MYPMKNVSRWQRISRRCSRKSIVWLTGLFVVTILVYLLNHDENETTLVVINQIYDSDWFGWKKPTVSFKDKHHVSTSEEFEQKVSLIKKVHRHRNIDLGYTFYNEIFDIIYRAKPKTRDMANFLTEPIVSSRYDSTKTSSRIFSEPYLSQFLQMSPMDLNLMKQSHEAVLNSMPDKAPKRFYKGDGIVYVGGGAFNWLTLLSIYSVRKLGSKLPIEVLIPKIDEFEVELCGKILPELNARCIYMPYVLPKNVNKKFQFKGYQYKALAILLSSFKNVLLLDSDNIPVRKPDYLFTKEPFKSKGLIVWPDFWKRTTSPSYYSIAGIEPSTTELWDKYNELEGRYEQQKLPAGVDLDTIPLHERKNSIPDPTSESGQLMINKDTHMKPLLVALYYNLYGPSHYYPLFSQGGSGEGDKETFLAATVATQKSYYQVGTFLDAFGYINLAKNFVGTGMGQFDPIQDYLHCVKDGDKPSIMFVHANHPKLNPWKLKTLGKIFNEDHGRVRLYGTGMRIRCGYDFEFGQWTNMKYLLCERKINLNVFEKIDRGKICEELDEHLAFLKDSEGTLE